LKGESDTARVGCPIHPSTFSGRDRVLAGAILRFGKDESTANAAWALYLEAPEENREALAKLFAASCPSD